MYRPIDDRLTKIVRDSKPTGKMNPGRPQKRWTEDLGLAWRKTGDGIYLKKKQKDK